MTWPTPKVEALLNMVGAVLKRDKKHLVYELPNGRNVVLSQTPSDTRRVEANTLRDIRAVAGLSRVEKPTATAPLVPRRRKPGAPEAAPWSLPVGGSALAAALRDAGVTEDALREEVAGLRETVERLEGRCLWLESLVELRSSDVAVLQSEVSAINHRAGVMWGQLRAMRQSWWRRVWSALCQNSARRLAELCRRQMRRVG